MPDSKITALTNLTAADAINDMFPIVDVSDNFITASGTTKRISVNNLLSSSPTASGAFTVTGLVTAGSATITGAATVGTTLGVTGVSTFAAGTALLPALTTTGDTNTGIYYPAADTFAVTTAGVERWRANSAGQVGIGVTPTNAYSTSRALQIGQGGLIEGRSNDYTTFSLATNAYLSSAGDWTYSSNAAANLYAQSNGAFTWASVAAGTGVATFTPAMTLNSSGNLLVGTTSNLNGARVNIKTASVTSALSLNGVTGDTAQESLVINKFDNNSTTSQVFARFTNNNGSGGSGQINGNGANACAFGSFSDSRLKENILTLPSQLANILSLRPVEFDYKDGSGHQIGFVAQEMQEVYSDAVGEQNGFLTVTGWSKTEARLVSAIQELAAKVQALEAKLA